jgi:hypothetical protein
MLIDVALGRGDGLVTAAFVMALYLAFGFALGCFLACAVSLLLL